MKDEQVDVEIALVKKVDGIEAFRRESAAPPPVRSREAGTIAAPAPQSEKDETRMIGFIGRLQLSDTGFAFDPQTGSTFSLNGAGIKVIRGFADGKGSLEIAGELAAEYALDASKAQRDVEDFVATLKGFELP